MVSNSFNMVLQDFLAEVERLRLEYGDTEEYQALRAEIPKDWPL